MKLRRPSPTEQAYSSYIANVPEDDILAAMQSQSAQTQKLLASVGESRADYRYAPGKWSIKEVAGHIEDCERVFAYRALSFARGSAAPLPGFDENAWMTNAPFASTSLVHRAESLLLVRQSSIALFRDLPDEVWDRTGTANDKTATVRALAYQIVGHERHHVRILRERYGIAT